MSHINLLPWREERRKELTSQFIAVALGIAIVAALLVGAGWVHAGNRADHQKARNQFLQNEIDILNTKLQEIKDLEATKQNLLARMNVIQSLQRSRPEIVHLFEELVKTIPEGVWLLSIKQSGKNITIDGKAESNARVSAYMRNLEASDWLKNPTLEVIQADEGTRTAQFTLKLQQESLNAGEDEVEEVAAPAAKGKGAKGKGKAAPKANAKADANKKAKK